RKSIAFGVATPALAGLIAACGGDDSEGGSDTGSSDDDTEDPAEDDASDESSDDSGTPSESGEPTAEDGTSDGESGDADEWIVALTEEPTGFDAAVTTYTFSNVMVETHM